MKLNGYHRAIVDFLATGYGVSDAVITHPGTRTNHPVLTFTFAGELQRMQVHSSGGAHNRDPMNLLALKKQDLRRMLGPPPTPISNPHTIAKSDREETAVESKPFNPLPLPAIVPTAAPADKPRSWEVSVAAYVINPRRTSLRFFLPTELVDAWGWRGGVSVENLGEEDWRLMGDVDSSTGLRPYDNRALILQQSVDSGTVRTFGLSPAEAVIVGASLLVHAPLEARRWATPKEKKLEEPIEPGPPTYLQRVRAEYDRHDEASASQPIEIPVTAERMRACLEEVRRIERSCPYRLMKVRDTGAWAFSAPRIE